MHTILIVESDDHALTRRGDELLLDGYEPAVARSDGQARHKLAHSRSEAMLLGSLDSPAAALALLRDLRNGKVPGADPLLPTITIGADTDPLAIRHYEAGADIVLTEDPSPLLVASALAALAHRLRPQEHSHRILRVGTLCIDCDARTATVGSTPVELTRLEFDLLEALAHDPHKVHTRAQLSLEIWHTEWVASRTIDSHASRLRLKLTNAGAEQMPQTIRGLGYRLSH